MAVPHHRTTPSSREEGVPPETTPFVEPPPPETSRPTVPAAPSHRLLRISQGDEIPAEIHQSVGEATPILKIENFSLWYGRQQVLFNISMPFAKGKVSALIGPSGCGKSTLLRSMNRLNDLIPSVRVSGTMTLADEPIYRSSVDVIALRKRMGMVFQKPNPFPMSIFENVVYPLRIDGERNRSRLEEACERSLRAAALWEDVKDRLRKNALRLSGGEQQRLCLARAIASQPEILLLDEPCSSLDPIATGKIEDLLQDLTGSYTVILVTHNMQQAARASHFTALMYAGRLLEYGRTSDLFTNPHLKETNDYVTGRFG
ncbi:Phosphate import ATP-binding protein PstB [Planctomycetales bacterium 10988]|nr:Phosphate import ATP-binding protein PstB [Planctomycetales bacterium 10988]